MKKNYGIIFFYVILIAVILIATATLFSSLNESEFEYSDVIELFESEQVKSFVLEDNNELVLKLADGKIVNYKLRDVSIFYYDLGELILEQRRNGILEDYDYIVPYTAPWWVSLIPYAVMIIIFVVLWMYFMNQATGKGGKINAFGKAKVHLASESKKKVFFSDVAGADEEKEELEEIVDFLRNPEKYLKLGAKIPHGVLLVGPPGTGKTLLAKAVAGEAGVPFYSISGSDFVEMYVGVGASRVRDLFEQAKKTPASIIFIDEIDAVGRHRGAGLGGGHDEREQTLNQLLIEMDGFDTNEGVIVMAATNRPDILDPALLRPGRFDRQVTVNYPDVKGREAILRVHSRNKPLEDTVDLKIIAKTTVGFTGADLANLLNESALLAARKGKALISMEDVEDATLKVLAGPKKKSKVMTEKDKKITAFHEAGHAIITKTVEPYEKVHHISIIPSGQAAGYTLSLPVEDRSHMSKSEMENKIVTLMGGRVAEHIVFGDVCTGASNDLQRASSIARSMIMKYGMSSSLGPVVFGSEHSDTEVFLGRDLNSTKNYSEATAAQIDEEVKKILDAAYAKAMSILEANRAKLDFVAEFLIKNEFMEEDQFEALMNGDPTMEELEAMAELRRRKSEEANKARREKEEEERKSLERKRAEAAEARRRDPFDDYGLDESDPGKDKKDPDNKD
ncbi:MAG: ATP-dependent zinc metalloprotease FtsH [Ruminococcaceae bacterium]|nr:ATP-dependent zinc metalloprotease FtsH [Oscillospiraceae bacterium]